MASLDCLDNLIGIRGECGTPTTTTSTLHIQDLPFLTIKNADAGISEENRSGFELIQQKIDFAEQNIIHEIRSHFSKKIKNPSVIENDTIGYWKDDLEVVAASAGNYGGINVKIDEYPYLEFYVGSIWLHLASAVTTNILVIDLISGVTLDTISITTVANRPTEKIVNKSYRNNKQRMNLIFVIDSGVSASIKTGLSKSSTDCRGCGRYAEYGTQYVRAGAIKIPTGDTKINANLDNADDTNGMILTYSLNCVIEPFICSIANQLALPLLYKSGVEILRELKYSRRLNSIVTIHSKDIDELATYYELQHQQKMNLLLQNIELPNDICFYCNPKIRSNTVIP